MFRDMLKKNPNRNKENPTTRLLFPSDQHSNILSRYVDEVDRGAGLLSLEFADFHRTVLTGGDEKAFNLLELLLNETQKIFDQHFNGCRFLFAEVFGLGEGALFFEHPKLSSP